MTLTKILTIAFLAVAGGIAYYLYDRVKFSLDEEQRIAGVEAQVIEKLKFIRDAEIMYRDSNGQFTSDWGKLKSFVDTGTIYITQRREITELLEYGKEETTVEIDTLGSIPVRDSLYSNPAYQKFDLANIAQVPVTNEQFELFADKIERNNTQVSVFEAKDPEPVNPERRSENSVRGPLRVGSRTEVTTSGNWE